MKQIQYVSKYLALSKEGLVSKLDCPIDQGLLFPNLDEEDNIFLYCLSCSYKKNIGLDMYNKIKLEVEKIEYESQPIVEMDAMGREKFWEDLGRPGDGK